jgi:hypothetical protein
VLASLPCVPARRHARLDKIPEIDKFLRSETPGRRLAAGPERHLVSDLPLAEVAQQHAAGVLGRLEVLGICGVVPFRVDLGQLPPRCREHGVTVTPGRFPHRRRLRQPIGLAVQVQQCLVGHVPQP